MPLPDEVVRTVHECVKYGRFRVGWHAVQHMFEEGFGHDDVVAVLFGKLSVLEEYDEENRALVLGYFTAGTVSCPLHVVCDFSTAGVVECVTAYIPTRPQWVNPR